MGDYATAAQLKARFDSDAAVAHLTHDEESGTPNDDILNEIIDHAEGEINTAIGTHNEIPVKVADHASLAAFMKQLTIDVASHALYREQHSITPDVQARYDAAQIWLDKFVEGVRVLPSPDTEPATTSREPGADWGTSNSDDSNSNRIFDRESMGAI